MTQFIKNCPVCGEILVERLVNVDVQEDVNVCHAESIPALVCENKSCSNQERYFAPFSYNLLKMKCPEINKL
ncbi:hypothetical protein P378_04585 [Desulforamulus profundi]|uniref:Uncharacterized protein n=1 Tax=Desulforamulus profundi TaxID=1383067 RepID=A0A2C6MID5_9FIRM|nr:hypothetical protein [Desulforamulus profundi]MCL5780104.1 hypothetical protein [Bacillota bacterium]PHJ39216.1 hypothetical protein P378_04585 [Desulforamulus profundi]